MVPACIAAFQTAFFGFTGSFETFRCQTLSAGNTSHAVPATGTAYAGERRELRERGCQDGGTEGHDAQQDGQFRAHDLVIGIGGRYG